jgi:C4-dicarboxylate-specific signal transduction histidine kinase
MKRLGRPQKRRFAPGIALKISSLVMVLLSASMVLVASTIDAYSATDRTVALVLFLVFAFLGSLAFAAMLDWLVTRPLVHMARQVRRMHEEGYETVFEPIGFDEPRELGDALEALRARVVEQQVELLGWNADLERRVEARTADLEATRASLVQAEKLASVGLLAGGVAHEVSNPNTVILARTTHLLSIADDEGLDPDVIEDLEVLKHQSERIQRITGSLLTFARRSEVRVELLDLQEVTALTADVLSHVARSKGLEIEIDVLKGCVVLGSRDAMEQLCFNLTKNAIDATPRQGAVHLRGRVDREEKKVRLCFDDSGPGISSELRAKMFDPFFTTKAIGEGTGLGLSIVHGIVESLGGELVVAESPEGGARFIVTFPWAEPGAGEE